MKLINRALSLQSLSSFVYNTMQTSKRESARQSYDPEFFSQLARIESSHFWFRTRNRVIGALAEQITKNWASGYRVLEVGCGTGNVLRALEQACPRGMVVGMDLFAEGLAFAR